MATAAQWWAGARPRTLPAALAPVAAGTGAAAAIDAAVGWKALLCLVVALALQIGVNYANDYSDGVRGTDADRIGPARLVGSGAASPAAVKRAAFLSFGVAAIAGLVLAATSGWWLLAVGAVAIASAWLYTGGPRPYGYAGLGEAFVFVFFGLVAVGGTSYVQAGRVTETGWVAAIGCGLLSVAILLANNLRDIPTDAVSGKRTLAVRLGDGRTRQAYLAAVSLALLLPLGMPFTGQPAALLALAGVWPAWRAARAVRSGAAGPALIPVLVGTGQALLLYGLGFGIGLALGG